MRSHNDTDRGGALVLWFEDARATAIDQVGGKNASLAQMTQSLVPLGIRIPPGFALTANAYWRFIRANELEAPMRDRLAAWKAGRQSLHEAGGDIRRLLRTATIPDDVRDSIVASYRELCRRCGAANMSVAVRSSATAEDLPEASFAGQQESYLNIVGEVEVVERWRQCVTSLFTDRAIAYRDENEFDHLKVALSVGVQKMVRSDLASAGVMFTIDTETGFPDVVLITGSWGLGENVVKGAVGPDEILLFKPPLADPSLRPVLRTRIGEKERTMVLARGGSATTRNVDTPAEKRQRLCISEEEALQLGRWALQIERDTSARSGKLVPMDIEWAKDGGDGLLYIVQARPETVQSQRAPAMVTWHLDGTGTELCRGRSVGNAVATAPACVIRSVTDLETFRPGSILVAESTDPDWVPALRVAAGVITEHGGRTCHAAIVSREMGIPAIVGAAGATRVIADGTMITLSCAGGEEGIVYEGAIASHREETPLESIPSTRTKVMINLADPASALSHWRLPTDGVGLARIEFIITDEVQVHPMALAHFDPVTDAGERARIEQLTRGYADKGDFFVDRLARGIAMIAASQHPRPVIVRMSDFKTNEYAGLLGGSVFEEHEENPMIGFRGASRYYSDRYRDGFLLECRAIRAVRETIGLRNIIVMIPFCRTLDEADRVLATMADAGLARGKDGLQVYVMCEIPSNVILATEFAERFDGFSIGSNDLTQLTLGVDRDSALLASLFDERNPAVTSLIRDVIDRAHRAGRPVGLCGQAPSDHADFAAFLVECGIDSISLNPDSFLKTKQRIAATEAILSSRPPPIIA
ncbi:MAG: phosphoenolpyruvate synthase [Gemmatimonadaceae bacterium]|nr:phosphoenolpyruvate synthase [Gemmatimonadaceae bacterium]